jgi:hypothetical protein
MSVDQLTSYLMPGEKVIWWGQPRQGFLLTGRDVILIPFSLLWGGFALFWETTVVQSGAPFFFRIWGVPFVLIGLYMILGRFVTDAWIRRNMLYALTNRRVLIARQNPTFKFTALNIDQLPSAELEEGRDGRGTIRFGASSLFSIFGAGSRAGFGIWSPALDPTPQLLGIEDARNVFNQIQKLAASRNSAAPEA